jgi:hypothetical protein
MEGAVMSNLKPLNRTLSAEELFARYHVGWETRDPNLIASLHSEDTTFWMHDGSKPVHGREALREHCAGLFAAYKFAFEPIRTIYGADHWIFEYAMVLDLNDKAGAAFTAKVDMLDVMTFDKAGLVTRKDVYMDVAQAQAAFQRAGIQRGVEN